MWNRNSSFRSFALAILIFGLPFGAAASEPRLAIKGYDPVAYFTESRPRVGDARFQHQWDGMVYRFASARHLDMFKADPEHYVPQYGNFCTAALSRGKRVVSDPNNWIIQNGRLHLFGKPIGPGLITKDPVAMKAKADANYLRVSELPWER